MLLANKLSVVRVFAVSLLDCDLMLGVRKTQEPDLVCMLEKSLGLALIVHCKEARER